MIPQRRFFWALCMCGFAVVSRAAGPAWAQATPTATPLVPNDTCETATLINVLPYGTVLLTTPATTDPTDPVQSCSTNSRAHSVWFRFDATSTAPLVVDTVGSNYDTVLSAFVGSCPDLTEVACNDDIGTNDRDSRLAIPASAGSTYRFMVASYRQAAGSLVFNARVGTTPIPTFTPIPTPTDTRHKPRPRPRGLPARQRRPPPRRARQPSRRRAPPDPRTAVRGRACVAHPPPAGCVSRAAPSCTPRSAMVRPPSASGSRRPPRQPRRGRRRRRRRRRRRPPAPGRGRRRRRPPPHEPRARKTAVRD